MGLTEIRGQRSVSRRDTVAQDDKAIEDYGFLGDERAAAADQV